MQNTYMSLLLKSTVVESNTEGRNAIAHLGSNLAAESIINLLSFFYVKW